MDIILVILTSTFKFAATFPVAIYLFQMSFIETVVYINIGGILGVLIFALLSRGILRLVSLSVFKRKKNPKEKKVFTRRNRMFVKIKSSYGLAGIVILTPLLLSIPVGTFLVTKYYRNQKSGYLWLIAGQVVWSVIYALFYLEIKVII